MPRTAYFPPLFQYEAVNPTPADVLAALNRLGGPLHSARRAAQHLHSRGFRGIPRAGCNCPLVHYLRWCFPAVDPHSVMTDGDTVSVGARCIDVPLPAHLAEFVGDFDEHRWPDLIKQTHPEAVPQ